MDTPDKQFQQGVVGEGVCGNERKEQMEARNRDMEGLGWTDGGMDG